MQSHYSGIMTLGCRRNRMDSTAKLMSESAAFERRCTVFIAAIVLLPMLGGCKVGQHASDAPKTASAAAATSATATNCVPPSTASTTRHSTQVFTVTAEHSPPASSLSKTSAVHATTAVREIPIGRIKPGEIGCPPKIQPPTPPATKNNQ